MLSPVISGKPKIISKIRLIYQFLFTLFLMRGLRCFNEMRVLWIIF